MNTPATRYAKYANKCISVFFLVVLFAISMLIASGLIQLVGAKFHKMITGGNDKKISYAEPVQPFFTAQTFYTPNVQNSHDFLSALPYVGKLYRLRSKVSNVMKYAFSERLQYLTPFINLATCSKLLFQNQALREKNLLVFKLSNGSMSYADIPFVKPKPQHLRVEDLKCLDVLLSETKKRNIECLFVEIPRKETLVELIPQHLQFLWKERNMQAREYKSYAIDELNARWIDLTAAFKADQSVFSNGLYKTDHHWTIDGAFWTFQQLAHLLQRDFHIDVPEQYRSKNSYKRVEHKSSFLGTQGQRVGSLYASIDDFSYLIPLFDVDITFDNEEISRRGTWEESMLFDEYLCGGSLYEKSDYLFFMKGICAKITLKNNLIKSDQKLLVFSDSNVNSLAPFLTTIFKEVTIIDLRAKQKLPIDQLLDEVKPDLVLLTARYDVVVLEKNAHQFFNLSGNSVNGN